MATAGRRPDLVELEADLLVQNAQANRSDGVPAGNR